MNQKAIFFDIDGTIFEAGKPGVSKKVIDAIHKTREFGHLCFIASGRPPVSLATDVKAIGFDGYICGNGSMILLNDQLYKQKTLHPKDAKQLIQLFQKLGLEYLILTTGQSCISQKHEELFQYYQQYNIDLNAIRTSYDLDEVLSTSLKIEVMTHTKTQIQEIVELCETLGYFVEIKADGYLECSDQNITKGTAILEILNHFHIPVEDSICFGDGMNDIDMFNTVGHSIAMGNAVDKIKEIADEVTLSVSEDGVAYQLTKMFNL